MDKLIYKSLIIFAMLSSLTLIGCGQIEALKVQGLNNDNQAEGETEPEIIEPIPEEIEIQKPWYSLSKPKKEDSSQEVVEACKALGQRAAQFKMSHFIIAFEGLASFSSRGTQELYEEFEGNPAMSNVGVPRKGSGGFMVNYLLWPALIDSKGSADFVVFSEKSVKTDKVNSQPDLCARAWLQANPKGKLVITGHSYGGHAANQLADILNKQNVPIEVVLTVDPRTKGYSGDLFKTSNAKYWINYYQRNTLFLNGYVVEGADENNNISSTGVSHGKMPRSPEVIKALKEILNDT